MIDGVEIANGYDEATDAAELQRRFAADQVARRASGAVVPEIDPYLLAALEAGLPRCAGVALGVDRLLDMTRTVVNITGDATVTTIVAKSEGELDLDVFNDPDAGQEYESEARAV